MLFHLKFSVIEKNCMKMCTIMSFRKNTSHQIRRNYRCQTKFLRNSKASFIKVKSSFMKQCTICNALIDLKVEIEHEHHEECHPEEENVVLKKA